MKAILMSIQPKWCELIASGKKTLEVRKTKPKLDVPFKVYIYESGGDERVGNGNFNVYVKGKGRKKVIGEFVCDMLVWVVAHPDIFAVHACFYKKAIEDACLTEDEVDIYSGGSDVYGYHISDLVIYDKPKELSEFRSICREYDKERPGCGDCDYYYSESNESIGFYEECLCNGMKPLARPPQSWCYVKEVQL